MNTKEIATLGNGCFWCTEAIFQSLEGVFKAESGYSGGEIENPTYEQVCTGLTGHAEVIMIEFDSSVITFGELLEVFFGTHDPTSINRQGNDVGTQYRSEIFYHPLEQKRIAEEAIKSADESGVWSKKIVTKISEFKTFYPAGNYHADYFNRVGHLNSYCNLVVTPKIEKFKQKFKQKLKKENNG